MKKIPSLLSALVLCVFFIMAAAQQNHTKIPSQHLISKVDSIDFDKDSNVISLPKNLTETKVLFIKQTSSKNMLEDWVKYILPILTLLLGIGINRYIDWYKDYRKVTRSGKRWAAEIRAWQEPIQQQIDLLEKLIKNDPINKYSHPELAVLTGLDGDSFKSLDKSELLQFIERQQKNNHPESIKTSNQVHGLISILANLNDALKEKFNDYLGGTSKYIGLANENLQKLLSAFAKFGVLLEQEHGDPMQNPFYKRMADLFGAHIYPHMKDGKYDLFVLHEEFFWPLVQVLGELRQDPRADELMTYAGACLNSIKGLKMEKGYWIENMRTVLKRYKEHLPGVAEIANKIDPAKTK